MINLNFKKISEVKLFFKNSQKALVKKYALFSTLSLISSLGLAPLLHFLFNFHPKVFSLGSILSPLMEVAIFVAYFFTFIGTMAFTASFFYFFYQTLKYSLGKYDEYFFTLMFLHKKDKNLGKWITHMSSQDKQSILNYLASVELKINENKEIHEITQMLELNQVNEALTYNQTILSEVSFEKAPKPIQNRLKENTNLMLNNLINSLVLTRENKLLNENTFQNYLENTTLNEKLETLKTLNQKKEDYQFKLEQLALKEDKHLNQEIDDLEKKAQEQMANTNHHFKNTELSHEKTNATIDPKHLKSLSL